MGLTYYVIKINHDITVEVINRFGHREINETWERQAPQPTPSV